MKKLLMAVAAVFAVASIASAATLKWGSQAQLNDKDGSPIDSGTVYLVYLGNNSDPVAADGSWNFSNDDIVATGHYLSGDPAAGVFYTSSSDAWGTFSGEDYNANRAGVYAVIATSDGTSDSAMPTTGYYTVLGTTTVSADDAANLNASAAILNSTDNVSVATAVPGGSQPTPAVPEPTTYALVGLAVAALALRKRLSK